MSEVIRAIDSEPWLQAHYEYGETFIRGKNGTEFIFRGLRNNPKEIKSTSGIGICWVEEAEAVSDASWRNLIPTIREPGSEIWLTWNPEAPDSSTHRRFIVNPPHSAKIIKLNWTDNPWFPAELEAERRRDLEMDPEIYAHVWDGECLRRTDAQVLNGKWRVAEFDTSTGTDWGDPLHGLDFGFANDPTTANSCWVRADSLYIDRESHQVKLELDATAERVKADIPGIEKYAVRADCARPESISYLARHGLPRIMPTSKWAGSVEDGISHLRSYKEIVVHPRCTETIREMRLYSYKVDKNTGDVLPVVVDAYNHHIDALRYALDPLIKRAGRVAVMGGLNVR
jgi:phage terminase large subunit